MKILFLALFITAATQAQVKTPVPVVDLFASEGNTGSGALEFKTGDKLEKVNVGSSAGHYALAMTFQGNSLPDPYKKDFKDSQILQLAFGTLKSKLEGKVAQFGAATIVTSKIPTQKTTYNLSLPVGKDPKLKGMAFLLFTSPEGASEVTNEEKLKRTYFAQTGTVVLTPLEKPKIVAIQSQGSKYTFNRQNVKAELTAQLATPFEATPSSLKGSVTLPLYWPHGKEAQQLTTRIALESLGAIGVK